MYSPVLLGCGGAGKRFARYVSQFSQAQVLTIDRADADILVGSDIYDVGNTLTATMIRDIFPWVGQITGDVLFVFAGLGGAAGTAVAELLGMALSSKKILIGLFSEPFFGESATRQSRAQKALENIKNTYGAVFSLSNARIPEYYPTLSMSDALALHPVVLRHLVQDFERQILPAFEELKLRGQLGLGIGFGVGRERIRVAIEDALDSPWHLGHKAYAFVSGAVEREDVRIVMRDYDFDYWSFYKTGEYEPKIKVTVISKN